MAGFNGTRDFGFLADGGSGGGGTSPTLLIIQCDSGTNSSRRCGNNNCASGIYSTAFGRCNTSNGCYSTISGGFCNIASGIQSTISGGYKNTSSGIRSSIVGGQLNVASGDYTSIGGGFQNVASCSSSTISGGYFNTSCGLNSFVGGGINNIASGTNAAVLGGQSNTASGISSSAMGCCVVNSCDYSFMSNCLRACNIFGATSLCANAGGTIVPSTSDCRLKENIASYELGLKELNCLQPRTYTWNEKSGNNTCHKQVGFIAQEVKEVVPESVFVTESGYYGFDSNKLMPLLTNAIKELSCEVSCLKKIIYFE
jgi:hypothetical protein